MCQKLYLAGNGQSNVYTIKAGDNTLSGIASAFHMTWQALAKKGIANPNVIYVEQTIQI